MRKQTEDAIRSMLALDPEVKPENVERAIDALYGRVKSDEELVHVIKRKDVLKMLGIHRRTLDYYLDQGYLERVYGVGKRSLGISRESFIRFTSRRELKNGRRVVRKEFER